MDLWCEFCVVAHPDDLEEVRATLQQAALTQRVGLGAALSRSWRRGDILQCHGATLVIAFAGADALIGGEPFAGGVPSFEFARAFREAGVGCALFVRDVLRSWYLRGIGDAGYTFQSVVDALRAEIDSVRPARLVTLGCSMGGYAAVRAGLALRADEVLAFGPQVIVRPADRQALGLPASPFDDLLRSVHARSESEGFALTSLIEALHEMHSNEATVIPEVATEGSTAAAIEPVAAGSDAAGETLVRLFAGDECEADLHEARLFDAAVRDGTPQRGRHVACEVVAVPGADHAVAAAMKASGALHELLCRAALHERGNGCVAGCGDFPEDFEGFTDCPDF